jgi:hypothetical protein
MSLTLSVTSSTTLFATNIPANATTLTFESSLDGVTYTTISSVPASPITIPTGTTAYSFTNQLIPSYYYRVTTGSGASSFTQYILQTRGAAGSSTSSFSNSGGSGLATIGSTSITMNNNGNSVLSDQTYSASQALYYQLTTPVGTSMGDGNYTVSLYNVASGTGSSSTISAYFRVTTSGTTTTVGIFRRDSGAEVQLGSNITVSAPTQLALYWDATNIMYYYVGNTLRTIYSFTNAWGTIRAAVQVAALTTPFTVSDARLYVTGSIPTAVNWRLSLSNVTTTSLAPTSATYSTYYYITNTGFNTLTLPSTFVAEPGAFWVLRNNTSVYLSISVANPGTAPSVLPSPLVIAPSNSATIVLTATGYVLF